MAKNLKKFVNLKFLKTCDLALIRRLLSRHEAGLKGFDLTVLDGDAGAARDALRDFFAGPESGYPQGLTADLHRIAELANPHGMRVLLERAKTVGVELVPASELDEDPYRVDAKYLAMRAFLDHRDVFDAASDLVALEATVALTEFRGAEEGVEATLDDATHAAFENEAKRMFAAELMGRYCRVGWYDDDDEINLVVVHGTEIVTAPVIESDKERVISYQPAGHAVLSYSAAEGRLKVGGVVKAQREGLAAIFAETILGRPGFFEGEDSQNLYTLEPVERTGFGFRFDHAFDPGIRSVKIVEAQADRITGATLGVRSGWQRSVLIKDRHNALEGMEQVGRGIAFGPDAYRLGQLGIRVEFDTGTKRHPRVTVKIKPPGTAMFKRQFFEGRIMELLRRNRLCLERESAEAAVAAQ